MLKIKTDAEFFDRINRIRGVNKRRIFKVALEKYAIYVI